MQFSIGKKIK